MDWLDEKVNKLIKWVSNLSLRKALIVYIITCIFVVGILYAVTMAVCDRWEKYIWTWDTVTSEPGEPGEVVEYTFYYDYSKLTTMEEMIAKSINFIQSWSMIIYSLGGIIAFSLLYYKHKLKQPLRILRDATDKVTNNNLDFEIYYDSKDEFGDLCHSFDLMRKELLQNNNEMWDMMEEQKRLNAAFAHDLRTPLTVLRGYTDFLREYIPKGKINEDKLLSTLSTMSGHIERLERYSNTMKEIYSFEEIMVNPSPITGKGIFQSMREYVELLDGREGISVKLSDSINELEQKLYLDQTIVMEVFENLLSNALRYAKTEVQITITADEENMLLISVADDGKGFSPEALSMAAKPYYTEWKDNSSSHFGIGLYICRLLCAKHGGWLSFMNRMEKGAIVTACFYIGKMDS